MKLFARALCMSAIFAGPAVAQDALAELELQPIANVAETKKDTFLVVEGRLESYISKAEQQVSQAGKQNTIAFFYGMAPITVHSDDVNWSIYRANALQEAMFEARAHYLSTFSESVTTQEISQFFNDNGIEPPSKTDFVSSSRAEAILDKAVDVFDGMLDSQLEKQGVNVQKYRQAPPEIRQTLVKQSFGTRTLRRVFGNLGGMYVTQTFEELDSDGRGHIGVIMVLSSHKRAQLTALIESGGNVPAKPSRANPNNANIGDRLKGMDAIFLEAGTKIWYDDQGFPMLVSFGQQGVKYEVNSSLRNIQRKVAREHATSNAWANIAATYNMSGDRSVETSQLTSQQQERITSFDTSQLVVRDEGLKSAVRNIIDKSTQMSASINQLAGVEEAYRWTRKHPITAKEMSGVVLVWHPQRALNYQSLGNSNSQENEQDSEGSLESSNHFDVDDF